MMRVLVVGTVPPPGGARAVELAALAARRSERGDEVEVWSPNPRSAAHRRIGSSGIALAARLAIASRRFDALELRIEAGLPFALDASRIARSLVFLALGAAISRYAEVTVRLDSPVPIPGGLGGRTTLAFWRGASFVVVSEPGERALVLAIPGMDPDRVGVEQPRRDPVRTQSSWPDPGRPDLRDAVLDIVRARAERDRAVARARATLGSEVDAAPAVALAPDDAAPKAQVGALVALALRRGRALLARLAASR